MIRGFDNVTIRELNKACKEIAPCDFDCIGIGWCDAVYEKVRASEKDWPSRRGNRRDSDNDFCQYRS